MRWWGKVIGGAVGWAIAGPVGAVLGLALGAIADGATNDQPEQGVPELDIDIRLIDDDFGRFVQLFFNEMSPTVQSPSTSSWTTADEPSVQSTPSPTGDNSSPTAIERGTEFYIPFSALKYRRPGTTHSEVRSSCSRRVPTSRPPSGIRHSTSYSPPRPSGRGSSFFGH